MNIDKLDLTTRTYNCLKRAGIDTIEKLRTMTESELIQVKNLSQKCIDEIKRVLKDETKVPSERMQISGINGHSVKQTIPGPGLFVISDKTVECPHCDNAHDLTEEEMNELGEVGKAVVNCEWCDKLYTVRQDDEVYYTS